MGWSIGYDDNWKRDIGYGVPAICDHPDCDEDINRGLAYVCCSEEPYGGEHGCGLFFCGSHLTHDRSRDEGPAFRCARCNNLQGPFDPKPDTQEWRDHKKTHPSWAEWREKHPAEAAAL